MDERLTQYKSKTSDFFSLTIFALIPEQFQHKTSVVSCMAFVLSLFVPHLLLFWCLGKAVLRDRGISWVSTYIFGCTNLLPCFPSFSRVHVRHDYIWEPL